MVFRNVFGIVVPFPIKDISKNTPNLTFLVIQNWIYDRFGKKVSKSSISQVKAKCGIEKLEYGCKANLIPQIKTENEEMVLEAFRFYNII